VFAVVEDEQQVAVPQGVDELVDDGPVTGGSDPQGGSYVGSCFTGIPKVAQVDEPDSIWVVMDGVGGGLESETGLARSSRAQEGGVAGVGQQFVDQVQLVVPANE
jgi:hypothetical protein